MIIAHRGVAEEPENTLRSFEAAVAQKALMVELDVRLSKDQVPVVIHDAGITRVTGQKGASVSCRTAANLVALGEEGAKIPTLESALKTLLPKASVNIELKVTADRVRPLVEKVVEVVERLDACEKVLLSSYHHHALTLLQWMKKPIAWAPLYERANALFTERELEWVVSSHLGRKNYVKGLYRPVVICEDSQITAEALKRAQAYDVGVVAYTIDDPKAMLEFSAMGLDGIITNRPGLMVAVLETLSEAQ